MTLWPRGNLASFFSIQPLSTLKPPDRFSEGCATERVRNLMSVKPRFARNHATPMVQYNGFRRVATQRESEMQRAAIMEYKAGSATSEKYNPIPAPKNTGTHWNPRSFSFSMSRAVDRTVWRRKPPLPLSGCQFSPDHSAMVHCPPIVYAPLLTRTGLAWYMSAQRSPTLC